MYKIILDSGDGVYIETAKLIYLNTAIKVLLFCSCKVLEEVLES